MKRLFNAVIVVLVTFLISCTDSESVKSDAVQITSTEKVSVDGKAKTVANIQIDGMTCAVGCAKRIEKKLNATTGVVSASVIFDDKLAEVEFDDNEISEQEMIELIQRLGDYAVTKVEVEKTVVKATSEEAEVRTPRNEESPIKNVTHRNISFPNIFDALTRLYRI